MTKIFENEFLRSIGMLSVEQQNKVLAYIKSLLSSPRKPQKEDILKFAGSIDSASLREMTTAIQADCENIDKNEW